MLSLLLAVLVAQASGPIEEIKAGARYVHVPLGAYVLTETLQISSGQTIVCESGATFQAAPGAFTPVHTALIDLTATANTTIIGCRFSMPPEAFAGGEPSEWRHVVQLVEAKRIRLEDVTIEGGGGDGLYIGPLVTCEFSECRHPSEDVTIERLTVTGAYRNGLSVISAINLTVRDSVFELTKGTAPQAGVDIEPDHGGDRLENVKFERCTARENGGSAYKVNLEKLNAASKSVSVTFTDCIGQRIPLEHELIEVMRFNFNRADKPPGFMRFDGTEWP